jgi:hypothetical protein
MRRKKAEELGLPILAKYVTTSVAGLAPRIMGIGPTYAIPMVLEQTGLTVGDVDLFEVCDFGALSPYGTNLCLFSRLTRPLRLCMSTLCANSGWTSKKSTSTEVLLHLDIH